MRRLHPVTGFKANVVHKECLATRNATLYELFGTAEVDVPESGVVQWTGADGVTVDRTVPVCDLQKELENVRKSFRLLVSRFPRDRHPRLTCSQRAARAWLSSCSPKRSTSSPLGTSGPSSFSSCSLPLASTRSSARCKGSSSASLTSKYSPS